MVLFLIPLSLKIRDAMAEECKNPESNMAEGVDGGKAWESWELSTGVPCILAPMCCGYVSREPNLAPAHMW